MLVVNTVFSTQSKTLAALENSGFSIEVLKNDSLFYWNKELPATGQQGKIFKQFSAGGFDYKFYFPL